MTTAEAGFEDKLPNLYAGKTYPTLSFQVRPKAPVTEENQTPDELFTMIAQSLLHGDRSTINWLIQTPEMSDAFFGILRRRSWTGGKQLMLKRWREN